MSIKQLNLAWGAQCETHTQKLVLLALADNADDGGTCWPSLSTLCRKTCLSRQGVIDQVKGFEKMKWLKVSKTEGKSNRYSLCIPVNPIDQSTQLTSQPNGLPPVNGVDHHQSTPQTTPVYRVDSNHQEPPIEPPVKPPASGYVVPACFETVDGFSIALEGWIEARKKKRNAPTGLAIQLLINRLAERPSDSVKALHLAIERGWATVKWDWFDRDKAPNGQLPKVSMGQHGKIKMI